MSNHSEFVVATDSPSVDGMMREIAEKYQCRTSTAHIMYDCDREINLFDLEKLSDVINFDSKVITFEVLQKVCSVPETQVHIYDGDVSIVCGEGVIKFKLIGSETDE